MTIRSLFIIDARVADQQTLIDSLPADSQWYLLDADADGIAQMLAVLANYSELESIQIISHGAPGTLYLGNTVLDSDSLTAYSDQLASLGSSLAESGDILLYGCNVAEGEQGQQFVDTLAQLTGADVAASTDLTGSASLGGDWALEFVSGEVESAALAVADYSGALAFITGTDGDDILTATDNIYGDILQGGLGDDTLNGGPGNDNLYGGAGNDNLLGYLGDDYLQGDQDSNLLDGGEGDDNLQAHSLTGQQTLIGGTGSDLLQATGASVNLSGGDGEDRLSASGSFYDLENGISSYVQRGIADLSGGTGDDNLYASQLSNAWLRGDEGIDILSVSAVKSALLEGGAGQDSLLADFSASSSNTLIGESYGLNYHLDGGEDNDTLEASGWAHNLWGLIEITLDGGAGNDILTLTDSSSTENFESYHPNGGVKQALLRGGDGDDRLTASGVLELTMAGGSGSDTFVLTAAQYRAQQLGPQEFATQQSTEENGWDSGNVRVAPRITVISDFDASEGDTLDVGDLLSNAGIGYDNSNPFASGYLKLTQSGADTLLEFAADGAAGEGLARVTVAKLINVDASTLNGANFHPPLPLPGVDHVNHAPTGSVTLGGTAREGETLTATSNLADADGLGEVHYQWLADGMAIEGATGSSLLLSEAQVGKAISVQARYIDASGTAESVTSAATAPAGGILSFPVWDNMGGSHQVTVGDLSGDYHWSVQVIETSRFLTAAVQFHGWQSGPYGDGQAKELRIIDLHTGQVLAGHTLQQDEFFLPSQGRETLIHIGQVEGSTLTIQAYGYGLDASDASLETPVGNTVTLTLPAEFNANYFHVSQYIPPADGTGYVLGWQWDSQSNTSSAMLYRGSNGGTLEPVTLPGSGDSASDAFVYQGQLWLRATSGEWQTPGWSETYYRLDPNHSGAGPNGWVTIDEDAYWNARDLSVGYESVVRDGEYALDLLDLVPQDYMVEAGEDEILALPGGGVLIRMEPESATDGLGYEHWVVFKDNAIIAQKTFTSDAGLNLRSVQAPEDGYVYFQQWNAAITKAATGEFIGITQNTNALSLYRVALADVTSILQAATASQTLAGLAGVEPVQNYTQAQLSNNVTLSAGQFVEIESYIPLAQHIANDTGAIVWSSVYDVSTDEDVYYVARIEANGTVTRTTSLPEEVEEVVIDVDNGVFFLTDWDEQEGNQAFHLDIATGRVVEISQELFLAIEENGSLPDGVQLNLNTAPTGMVTLSGTATQGQTLTASHTLADADGLGTVSYQWLADGVTLDGATGSTLVLGQAQVGKAISVRASYTDGRDQVESVRSSATAAVANVNDAPTGSVLIAGTATQGQTMTVSHTLADVDGLGTVSYQWLANGVAIGGATGNTLVLAQAQVGKAISVKVSYTDGFGTAESKTSAATATVARLKVTLTANNDAYSGTTGDDWVFGMDGNDSLSGLTGNDILDGGTGADVLNGGAGVDTMIGGNGNDTYYVDHASDVVSETSSTGGIDTVIASVTRTLGNYQENLTLSGTAAINGTGNALANRLVGNGAANVLTGGAGNDTLSSGAGNDRLVGGTGKDTLTGGTGNDIFDFNALNETGLTSTAWDVITDFVRGQDKIDLSTLDANTATAANDAFRTVIGSTTAFTAAGQLKVVNGVLYGNTDADSTAEFAIQLTGISSLSTADFIL